MLVPKDSFGDYVIDGVVGHGGSATVYRAHTVTAPGEAVALKVLADDHRDPTHMNRLLREFEFANRAKHPHVVDVFDAGPDWVAMELAVGGTITKLDARAEHMTALAQIADALDYIHQIGIVHCDVKPTNILVRADFSASGAILIDFGSARALTDAPHPRATRVEASLPYAAPEVLRGQAPSAASDEYAFACTTVELVTGSTPFTAVTAMALVDDHLNSPVPRFSRRIDWIPRAFDSILAKAMAKDPDFRYRSCSEFIGYIARAIR